MKSERGAITLFVLVTCMFMMMVLMLVNFNIINKNSSERRQLLEIEKRYTVTESDLEREYQYVNGEL